MKVNYPEKYQTQFTCQIVRVGEEVSQLVVHESWSGRPRCGARHDVSHGVKQRGAGVVNCGRCALLTGHFTTKWEPQSEKWDAVLKALQDSDSEQATDESFRNFLGE
ncbi:hypothetical protein ASH01_11480 [Terrabacter sp. Soil811]|uniref:hypothetical protein n=1 Tax=Terrabacter sp. Soil811 TaxID=1736419 RepID=UPI0006FDF6FA|nr:hypothetical protein [Terrabacter sp. Soil811]KRF44606.1 hypothetical protein ASH01_11480 [Terrabacter sp. Soil811]